MLEELANFDDHLLEEELLEEIPRRNPPRLKAGIGSRFGGACLFGVAEQDYGVNAIEALLREALSRNHSRTSGHSMLMRPWPSAENLLTPLANSPSCESGKLTDGIVLNGVRAGGLYRLMGSKQQLTEAQAGELWH